jgi:transposase
MGSEKARVWRTVAEKRRIVELTLQPGMSVARVAQAEGVNSHQVFQWRRAYRQGGLDEAEFRSSALLPVVLAERGKNIVEQGVGHTPPPVAGVIHIELPGGVSIRVERGADIGLLQAVLERLRK